MNNFGSRLRELRKERGIPMYALAEKLGISRNTLANWERGEKEPHGIGFLEDLAKILDVPLEELLLEKDEETLNNNPVIQELKARITRLEQLFNRIYHR